jgi:hypothetical protein
MANDRTRKKYFEQISFSGYMMVSSTCPLAWRKREILNNLVKDGAIVKYKISPSYDGYRFSKEFGENYARVSKIKRI